MVSGQSETLQDSKICIFFVNRRVSHSLNLKKRFELWYGPEKKNNKKEKKTWGGGTFLRKLRDTSKHIVY